MSWKSDRTVSRDQCGDFYGKEAYVEAYQYLKEKKEKTGEIPVCMVGFVLKNTLSENGGVTRGVCEVDENGYLTNIVETHNIIRKGEKAVAEDGAKELELDTPVSMNMWGLQPNFWMFWKRDFMSSSIRQVRRPESRVSSANYYRRTPERRKRKSAGPEIQR